ncbi:MAG: hypothetical protein KA735_12595 [Burkholderiaceae bacterium]|nr:hypothetical protein [Burkholderiaceae bacterium]
MAFAVPLWQDVDIDSRHNLESIANRLALAGARFDEVEQPESMASLYDDQRAIMNFEASRALLYESCQFPKLLSPGLTSQLSNGWDCPRANYDAAQQRAIIARRTFASWTQGYDVLLTPSAPGAAPLGIETAGSSIFNRNWSLLGAPCIALPSGKNKIGLPLGLQVVGRYGRDAELLSWAIWIESAI